MIKKILLATTVLATSTLSLSAMAQTLPTSNPTPGAAVFEAPANDPFGGPNQGRRGVVAQPRTGTATPSELTGQQVTNPVANAPIDFGQVVRAEDQLNGDYGPIGRGYTNPLGRTQDAWQNPEVNMANGQRAPGVVHFSWSPDLIMGVRLRENMVSTVTVPSWETIDEVIMGEDYHIQSRLIRPNVIGIKTTQTGIDGNIIIVGKSGNLYNLYVRTEGYNSREITDMNININAAPSLSSTSNGTWNIGPVSYSSQTQAPQTTIHSAAGTNPAPVSAYNSVYGGQNNPGIAMTNPAPAGITNNITTQNASFNGEYIVPRDEMYFGHNVFKTTDDSSDLVPDYVYDDGVWTYFVFHGRARSMDRPVVMRVVDGIETRVNTRTAGRHGEVIIAEALGDFTLRNGDRAVCVKRESEIQE